jgi:hypothetical protein
MRFALPVVVLASIAPVLATPDFSGTWVLVEPQDAPEHIARSLTVRQTTETRSPVGQGRTEFTTLAIERFFASGVRRSTYQIGVVGGTVNGAPSTGPTPLHRTMYAVTWDGDVLLLQTGSYSEEGGARRFTEDEERWSLKNDRLVIVAIHRSSETPEQRTKASYQRRR